MQSRLTRSHPWIKSEKSWVFWLSFYFFWYLLLCRLSLSGDHETHSSAAPSSQVALCLIILTACQPLTTPAPSIATPCSGESVPSSDDYTNTKASPNRYTNCFAGRSTLVAKNQVITFWHSYSLNTSSLVKSLIAEFNRENSDGIHVDVKAFYTDDQLQNALADIKDQKDMPDVILGETALLSSLDSDGSLPDLVNYISDPHIGLTGEQQKAIGASDWETVTRQNKVLGLPAQKRSIFPSI